ncbi:MAG: septal ring lytic transglycosylase RlpA family protein [Steroidobacteraceae bacterium]
MKRPAFPLAMAMLGLGACSMTAHRPPPPPAAAEPPRAGTPVPANVPAVPDGLLSTPDAIPRYEPRSRYGNPPFYDVFGRRYYVMASSLGYLERGVASWYGPGFHAERTSVGEPYDMYGMTAAHKTLSLPTYVRVTNLENNRSVVVRVNDRGPFVGNRIIDLSYTAAAKLDMLRKGTAFVEVRAIDPLANPISSVTPLTSALLTTPGANPPLAGPPAIATAPLPASGSGAGPSSAAGSGASSSPGSGATPVASAARAGLYVQAGAFTNRANAERLASRLRAGSYGSVFVRESQAGGRTYYRVRIGPVADVPAFDRTVKALERAGVQDAHLALE